MLFDLTLTDEQRMTRESVQRFAEAELAGLAKQADDNNATPAGFYEKTLELGLGLMPIPEALGGAGVSRSPISNVLTAEDLANGDMSPALGALTPLAFINTLIDQGTEAQQEKYLPRFCGEDFAVATIAFMEPRALFEPTELQIIAKRQGDGFTLSGSKTMVPPGLDAMRLMTWRAAARAENGEDFHEEAYLTKTFCAEHAMEIGTNGVQLLGGHGFTKEHPVELWYRNLRAMAIGCARAALDLSREMLGKEGVELKFDKKPGHLSAIEAELVKMEAEWNAARLLVQRAAWMADNKQPNSREASMCKAKAGRMGNYVTLRCVELCSSLGYSENELLEKFARDSKILDIFEGTQQIQQLIVARRVLGKSSSELK